MQGTQINAVMASALYDGAEFRLENHGEDIIHMIGWDEAEEKFLVRNERTRKEFHIEGTRLAFPIQRGD